MGGDEGERRVLRQPNDVGWANTAVDPKKKVKPFQRKLQLELNAGAVPAAKRVEFHS